MDRLPEVSVIIVAYRTGPAIVDAIDHHRSALPGCEIIVVDNASGDDTAQLAATHLPPSQIIANQENVGYGAAVNQGLRRARGRYVLILNDDARLDASAYPLLKKELERDDRVALVGPRIVDSYGMPMPSARFEFPGLREEWTRLAGRLRGRPESYPDGAPAPVAWLVGAAILGRTELLRKVGGFNPAFFLYGEDIDLGRRLHELGFRSVTVPDAVCVHVGESSTSRVWDDRARTVRRMRARDLYARIWLSRPERMLLNLRRAIGISNQPHRLAYYLPRVLYDGPSLRHLRFPPPLTADR